jgi:hypothetical protein
VSEPALDAADAALLARAAACEPALQFSNLTVERLSLLTSRHGLELTTALFYDRALRTPSGARFRTQVADAVASAPLVDLFGIVPGAFHGQHKHTGADGVRLVRVVQGLATKVEILPTRSFGGLEENAAIILDWLERHRGARIALASLSKGGADIKRALAPPRAASAFASVAAWISFSGIVQGTSLVAWLRARPLRSAALGLLLRFQGNRAAVIDELHRAPDSPLAIWPSLPPELRLVHVNGCPLRKHLRHRWAPRGYERLAPLGPNDGGGILLGDLAKLPGAVYPIWGTDHYLEPGWDATGLLRAIVVATLVSPECRHAQASASAPTAAPAIRSTA